MSCARKALLIDTCKQFSRRQQLGAMASCRRVGSVSFGVSALAAKLSARPADWASPLTAISPCSISMASSMDTRPVLPSTS